MSVLTAGAIGCWLPPVAAHEPIVGSDRQTGLYSPSIPGNPVTKTKVARSTLVR